ncbi:MAG: radical SAM family heme chaperone HemW [Thermodesulfovibrionales bacterium]|nr:radical SAM family heme chaperone HemW [Thermodesulfovibrionales bacterium]
MRPVSGKNDSGVKFKALSELSNGVYIHIPFCIKKCLYCDFLSVPYNDLLARAYTDALCKELILKKDIAGQLKTVYIGGGTPSILSEECFRQLFKCLKENFKFSDSPEITVEANPGTVDKSKIDTMLSLGVNRLSIGVQSFNDNELKTLGRIHTSDEALKAIETIKNSGINNFSIDLIYGIQGQTLDSWKKTLSKAVELSPAHISSYELTLEEGTPLYKMIKSEETNPSSPPFAKGGMGGFLANIKMPAEELILDMYNYAIEHLTSKGYEHYEISNFALHGFRCLHNLNYWSRGEYIGAGAGAHSFIRGFRLKNTDDIRRYIKDLNKGIIPEAESVEIKCGEAIKEFIFLNLRKTEGISLAKAEALGLDMPGVCMGLIEDGYLEIKGDYLRLSRQGLVISNSVIVRLFEELGLD